MSDEEELREILAELEREGVICPSSRLDVAMKRLLQRKGRDEVRRKSAPLVRALNDAGLEVESVWDLIGREYDFDSIIPVLLDHLEKPYPRVTREGILRALDVKGTGPLITKRLIELFRLEQDPEIKILTGSVLANFGDPAEIDDMVKLLQDRSHGGGRIYLPRAVARILRRDAIPILMPLLNQAGFGAEVIYALGKLKATEAIPAIRKFTQHEDAYVRQRAKAALRKLEKA